MSHSAQSEAPTKNIILVGFMGCGKSTIARVISKQLNYPLLDTDAIITKTAGTSIPEIFKLHGEDHFRDLETKCLADISSEQSIRKIISTGGGLPLREKNRQLMKSLGYVVWLQANVDTILKRTKNNGHRPLLNVPDPRAEIQSLLDQRKSIYADCADLVIQTDDLAIAETAHGIIESARYHFSSHQ